MDLAKMLAEMGREETHTPVKDVLEEAQDFVKRYHEKEDFVPGDPVVWKDGMKNVKYPEYGEPIIVLEVFDAVRKDEDGTVYGSTPTDMRCIVSKAEDGNLDVFGYDSHCFTKYKG